MDVVVKSIFGVGFWKPKISRVNSLDWVDRLNCAVTVYVFLAIGIINGVPQIFGKSRIRCWCPAEYSKDFHFEFINDYCWTMNTYHIPEDELIPENEQERQLRKEKYYQWVPLIVFFQAFMFYFPKMLWVWLNSFTDLCLDQIEQVEKKLHESIEDKTDSIVHLADLLDRWLNFNHKRNRKRIYSIFMTALYLLIKIFFLAIAIAQFFILNHFLGKNYNLIGLEIIKRMTSGEADWRGLNLFPRATLCDFHAYQLQNIQTFTIQCVLPYNLFYEKVFIFIWFWMAFVAAVTCIDLGMWCARMALRQKRIAYVKKYLEVSGVKVDGHFLKFVDQHLGVDGVFVLRVIGNNFKEQEVTNLVNEMWTLYKKESEDKLL